MNTILLATEKIADYLRIDSGDLEQDRETAIERVRMWCSEKIDTEPEYFYGVTDFDMDWEVSLLTPDEWNDWRVFKQYDGDWALDYLEVGIKSDKEATIFKMFWSECLGELPDYM